ncbi:MAG: type II secretion system protein [Proteobacteria bacterium]|nr:type II secretion system protein [Pseudomonadota bacterium]HQR04206.1 type II secretion system protein [Rhodocyclaceae bacterium]
MRSDGFTLIELITVMILIGILAAVGLGRIDYSGAFDQRAVLDKTKAALEFARKSAVAQRRYVCILIAGNKLVLSIDSRDPDTGPGFICSSGSSAPLALPVPDKSCSGGQTNAVCATAPSVTLKAGGTVATCAASYGFNFNPQGQPSIPVAICANGLSAVVEADTGYVH